MHGYFCNGIIFSGLAEFFQFGPGSSNVLLFVSVASALVSRLSVTADGKKLRSVRTCRFVGEILIAENLGIAVLGTRSCTKVGLPKELTDLEYLYDLTFVSQV